MITTSVEAYNGFRPTKCLRICLFEDMFSLLHTIHVYIKPYQHGFSMV